MRRVAILALSAKSYGGDSYMNAVIPALERFGGEHEFIIFARKDSYKSFESKNGKVKIYECDFPLINLDAVTMLWEQFILPVLLYRLDIDVVYTAKNLCLFFTSLPCVISIRNMWPLRPLPINSPVSLIIRYHILRFLTLLSLRRANRLIAVSEFVRDNLVTYGVPVFKIDVIPHGIDDATAHSTLLDDEKRYQRPFVASAGKFIPYANLNILIRSFSVMKKMGYPGKMLFAGGSYDAVYEREVKKLTVQLKIEDDVLFLGYISKEKILALLRNCDVFLYASTLEACPFTLLEAMREGAPIVTTTSEPMPEFCSDAAIYVDANDYQMFGEAGFRVASSQELQCGLREKGKRQAAKFTWERSVKNLLVSLERAV